jgi:hypothetical protein
MKRGKVTQGLFKKRSLLVHLGLLILWLRQFYCEAQTRPVGGTAPPVALAGSANPRILRLAVPAVIYRQLHDTSAHGTGHRVRVVRVVNRSSPLPGWIVVNRARSTRRLSADTTTYFLRLADIKPGSATFVLL